MGRIKYIYRRLANEWFFPFKCQVSEAHSSSAVALIQQPFVSAWQKKAAIIIAENFQKSTNLYITLN
jgi:hypothetical protein